MTGLWKRTQGWKLPLLGLAGLSFALMSVLGRASVPPKTPLTMPPVAPYAHNIAGIGTIEPKGELIAIGTELPGIVRNIHVQTGQQVQKGAALFTLDTRAIDAEIATLQAALESAQIQARDAAARFRLVADIKDRRAVAEDDYNSRKYAAELGKSRVGEITAQLQQAQTTKQRLSITAPITGTILDVNIRPGEFAATGPLAEPLIRMGDLSTLHVRVEFDEEFAPSLGAHSGGDAQGWQRGDTKTSWPLRLVRIEPYVAAKQNLAATGQRVDTRVVQAIYALPADAQGLLTGQQMDVYVQTEPAAKGAP